MNAKTPVIIDCDGSPDTLFGLAYAAHKPQLSIVGITVCAGKNTLQTALANTHSYAQALGISAPVLQGSARPVITTLPPENTTVPKDGYAWDFIQKKAAEYSGELQVICFGPMTNLAIALFKYPTLNKQIKRVVFSGGSYDYGNAAAVVERNMHTDPEAALAVFRSGIARTMVGYNVQRQFILDEEALSELSAPSLFQQAAKEALHLYGEVCIGPLMAASLAAGESMIQTTRYAVLPETKSTLCRGRTTPITMYYPPGFEKDTDVAMTLNKEACTQNLHDLFSH